MRDKISTLLIYATGAPRWERTLVDTTVGTLGLQNVQQRILSRAPSIISKNKVIRSLLSVGYSNLSYVNDWLDSFHQNSSLTITLCNINNYLEFQSELSKLHEYELIVILHSAAGDNLNGLRNATSKFQKRRGKLVVFFGNEYNLIPEKIRFARDVEAEYIASQLPEAAANWLYSDCQHSKILLAPPALNPTLYKPNGSQRSIDIGFRGDSYCYSLGDRERTALIVSMKTDAEKWHLNNDIEFVRYPREEWVKFLNRCCAIVGAESGTYYLEKTDKTQRSVMKYLSENPKADFEEIYSLFFKNYAHPISGKAISSRHFEPIGTKTCQILIEGHYNGILIAGEHYISVKKDFSNLSEAIRLYKDTFFRQEMTERSYEFVLQHHTYKHRVDTLLQKIFESSGCH